MGDGLLKRKSMEIKKSNRDLKKQLHRMTHIFELPAEAVCGDFRLISISNKDVCLENHLGILEYTQKKLKVASKGKSILFMGNNIVLRKMGRKNLIVHGDIDLIEFMDN